MHVLIIPTLYPNDYNPVSNIFFRDQAEALANNGITVGVLAIVPITMQQIIKQKRIKFGLKVFKKNNVTTYLYQFPVPPKSFSLQQILRKIIGLKIYKKYLRNQGKPDLLHVHTYKAGITAIAIKEKYNIPFVVTEHSSCFIRGSLSQIEQRVARKTFSMSSCNLAVSVKFVEKLEEMFSLKFNYLPNVVDTDFFRPSKRNVKSFDRIVFLNIANLVDVKQQDLLLNAFSEVVKVSKNVILRIGGTGPKEKDLRLLIDELGLNHHVYLLGKLSRDEVRNEMQQCDAFVLSSKAETFGVVIIEAMACGKPVISTKSGGPDGILVDEEYGFLVEQKTASLKKGLMKFISLRTQFESQKITKYINSEYSPSAICNKCIDIYKRVLI